MAANKKQDQPNNPEDDPDNDFQQLIQKYSHYLNTPHDPQKLLEFGQKLFDDSSTEEVERPSYVLLKRKEQELSTQEVKSEAKVKALPQREKHLKQDQSPMSNQDSVNEEILYLQDKNALSLARRKRLEAQRNKMLEDYGQLMEQSVQRKVQLKLDMQKLKAELNEALSRSRPEAQTKQIPNEPVEEKRPIMEELADLNQQVLMRIGSFKMALSNSKAYNERAVLDRYKPHMEKILGQIYAYSEYLPVNVVIEKFTQISDEIDHETRKVNTQLKNEHERNFQLQKEATQLGEEVKEHEIEVSRLKQRNAQLQKEISLLKEIAENEIEEMKKNYKALLEDENDDDLTGPPLSSRAVVVNGEPRRKMKRSPSTKEIITRERAAPTVPPIEKFVEMMKAQLLDKINRAQNN